MPPRCSKACSEKTIQNVFSIHIYPRWRLRRELCGDSLGYNVLMFDFRGHGRSEGQHVSMGYYERQDLLGAVDYLQRWGIDRVGVMGFSMGGAVAMATAPHSEAIRAVVSDGGFACLSDAIAAGVWERGPSSRSGRGLPGFLASLVGHLIMWLMGLRLGC